MDPMLAKAFSDLNLQRTRDDDAFYETHSCAMWYNMRRLLHALSTQVISCFERARTARRPCDDTIGQV